MELKQATVVVANIDVSVSRKGRGVVEARADRHTGRAAGALWGEFQLTGEDTDLLVAQGIIAQVTGFVWQRTHTGSMVSELRDLLRNVAGV
jgi:hypothetical protein